MVLSPAAVEPIVPLRLSGVTEPAPLPTVEADMPPDVPGAAALPARFSRSDRVLAAALFGFIACVTGVELLGLFGQIRYPAALVYSGTVCSVGLLVRWRCTAPSAAEIPDLVDCEAEPLTTRLADGSMDYARCAVSPDAGLAPCGRSVRRR